MTQINDLEFSCLHCSGNIAFSFSFLQEYAYRLECPSCEQSYCFDSDPFKRQLEKFVKLCYQIRESEEILGMTEVGVNLKDTFVKIPYKLLLTRLTPTLKLHMGENTLEFAFRIQPSKDSW